MQPAACLAQLEWLEESVVHDLDTQHSQSSRGDRSEHVSCDVGEGFMYVVSVLFPPPPTSAFVIFPRSQVKGPFWPIH